MCLLPTRLHGAYRLVVRFRVVMATTCFRLFGLKPSRLPALLPAPGYHRYPSRQPPHPQPQLPLSRGAGRGRPVGARASSIRNSLTALHCTVLHSHTEVWRQDGWGSCAAATCSTLSTESCRPRFGWLRPVTTRCYPPLLTPVTRHTRQSTRGINSRGELEHNTGGRPDDYAGITSPGCAAAPTPSPDPALTAL